MSQFLFEYGLFLAKAVTWVIALLTVAGGVFALARQARSQRSPERLEVKNLNERYEHMADVLNHDLLTPEALKAEHKRKKARDKDKRRADKQGRLAPRSRVFVLDFHGDIAATKVECLREEISAILQVARDGDEVLLRLESSGGMVHAYGLAASQLTRLGARGVRLTAAIDKVAASGGYLMACVAQRILAAPFAVVGSIGVVAQLPNFNRLLKKHEIDFELHTAGEYKRTLTLFGENTEEGRAKFRAELEDTHALFKGFVTEHRPRLDIEQVATGEHWFGARALALKLIDEIKTSDDYLLERVREADVFGVSFKPRRSLADRVAHGLARITRALGRAAA